MTTEQRIVVKVEFPRLVKGTGTLDMSYYAYPITLTIPNVAGPDARCERRYADFDALHSQLRATYWYCIVPPLPEKESVQDKLQKINPTSSPQQSKDSEHDLLEYRRTALKRFLIRVAYHSVLGQSPLLARFVRDEEWRQCAREQVKLPDFLSPSLADMVLGKAMPRSSAVAGGDTAGTAYSRAVAPADPTSAPGGTPQLLDAATLEATGEYVLHLESSLRALRDRFQFLVSRRRAAATAMLEFTAAFAEVGEGEEDAALAQAIAAVRDHGRDVARISSEKADEESAKVVSTLGYYVGMCAAVGQTLQFVQTGIRQVDTLVRRAKDIESGLPRADQASREQMQNNLRLLTEQAQRLDHELVGARQVFQDELVRFHRDKQFDLRELLKVFGELELKYAGTMKHEWDALRPMIERLGA